MYQFFSSLPDSEINKRYLRKFSLKSFNNKFGTAIRKVPELNGLFPPDFKGSKILIFDFYKLTVLYYSYLAVLEGLNGKRKSEINAIFAEVFKYSSHQKKLKTF